MKSVKDENYFEEAEVFHSPSCWRERPFPDQQIYGSEMVCAVGWELEQGGGDLRGTLKYAGTPVEHPGVYRIEAWHEVYHGFDYTEHDGGLGVLDPFPAQIPFFL